MARHPHRGDWQKDWQQQGQEREPAQICSTTGKRTYGSEQEARATAEHRLATTDSERPAKLRVYRCLFCDGWHLTSKGS